MLDIERMSKQLTHDEYEEGRNLFNILRERGFPVVKAVGIVYRAGRLKGKRDGDDVEHRLRVKIGLMQGIIRELEQSQPKAIVFTQPVAPAPVEAEEGSIVNE